jgi:endonuclease/exonuclease/phosphatase family metal-dependent hydrolase
MKKIFLMLALAAMPMLASTSNAKDRNFPKKKAGTVRIVQYNVGVFNKTEQASAKMVADMMTELGVDAVSLNELDSCATRTGKRYQLKDFADAMGGWDYTYAAAMPFQGGAYGVGVASERDMIGTYTVHLPKSDGTEPRALAVAEFKNYVVASTHLDYKTTRSQLDQMDVINDWVERHYGKSGKPFILCLDANATPDSKTMKTVEKKWTIHTTTKFTYSAQNPKKCIDYIMVYKNGAKYKFVQTFNPMVFEKGDVKLASDHLPLFVDFKF